jgi:hypothetical protein
VLLDDSTGQEDESHVAYLWVHGDKSVDVYQMGGPHYRSSHERYPSVEEWKSKSATGKVYDTYFYYHLY